MPNPNLPSAAAHEAALALIAGAIKGDADCIEQVVKLPLCVWHTPIQREVARAIAVLLERDQPVEPAAILEVADSDLLGPPNLSDMSVPAPTPRPEARAKQVFKDWQDREIIRLFKETTDTVSGLTRDQIRARIEQINGVINSNSDGFMIRLTDVVPESIEWLWPGWLALGKLAILDGDPGLGKSTLTSEIAARVSTGRPFPGVLCQDCDPGGVVIVNAEDGLADTVLPRLLAAGADLERIVALTEVKSADGSVSPLSFPEDVYRVRKAVKEIEAKLIIVDPLMAFLPSKVNAHRDQDVRRVLYTLKMLAEDSGAALLLIRHLNKTAGSRAIYRGGGSIGIIGAARIGWLLGIDPKDPAKRVLACTKSNLGTEPSSLGFRIGQAQETEISKIEWLGEVQVSAADLVLHNGSGGTTKLSEARDFLVEILAEGPKPQKEIEDIAKGQGIGLPTLRRAKGSLGIESQKVGQPGEQQYWVWQFPEDDHQIPGGDQRNGCASSGGNGHLRGDAISEFLI